ncbi:hypothetical protein QN357_18750, partial [Cryobacterium sp. RTC2.1]|nr:hypothetical protein [Cryobacterium sp. RTC2.1]
ARVLLKNPEVLILDEATIVESGTHGGLLAANGVYARLYSEQVASPGAVSGAVPAVAPSAPVIPPRPLTDERY